MKYLIHAAILLAIAFLLNSCGPVYNFPRTGTGYAPNQYRLGRTLGSGRVHLTTGFQTMSYVDNEGNGRTIDSRTGINHASAITGELTAGIMERTDIGTGISFGFYGPWEHSAKGWSLYLQRQLSKSGRPFAVSLEPSLNLIWGEPNTETAPATETSPSPHAESMEAKLSTAQLRLPMSYRQDDKTEIIWSVGVGYFEEHARYTFPAGEDKETRVWISPIGSLGLRVGAFTFEGAGFSNDGDPSFTVGVAFRVGTPPNPASAE